MGRQPPYLALLSPDKLAVRRAWLLVASPGRNSSSFQASPCGCTLLVATMFCNFLVIGISLPLNVYWIVQVARLLREGRTKQAGTLPPPLAMLGI